MTKEISDVLFEQEVIKSTEPVLIDFWADWCGPCKMLTPILDQLSDELSNIKIVKMNIDHNPNTPSALGVRSIPTMVIFKNGKQIATKIGLLPKKSIQEWIASSLN